MGPNCPLLGGQRHGLSLLVAPTGAGGAGHRAGHKAWSLSSCDLARSLHRQEVAVRPHRQQPSGPGLPETRRRQRQAPGGGEIRLRRPLGWLAQSADVGGRAATGAGSARCSGSASIAARGCAGTAYGRRAIVAGQGRRCARRVAREAWWRRSSTARAAGWVGGGACRNGEGNLRAGLRSGRPKKGGSFPTPVGKKDRNLGKTERKSERSNVRTNVGKKERKSERGT